MSYYFYTCPDNNSNWLNLDGRWDLEKLNSIKQVEHINFKIFKNDIIFLESDNHKKLLEIYGIRLEKINDKEREEFILKINELIKYVNENFTESKTYIDSLSELLLNI